MNKIPPSTLVTGSTGYVGAFVVEEVLTKTSSDVICLVRDHGGDNHQKLVEHLESLGIHLEDKLHRLKVVIGDITKPRLGLVDYDALSVSVSHVIHCAAWTNHLRPYSDLAATNVDSVKHFIAFCFLVNKKTLSFVSSLGGVAELTDKGELSENFPGNISDEHLPPSGYGLAKFRAEQLIKKAIDDGLECKVMRLGQMTGDSQNGKGVRWDDHLMLQLKECVLSAYAADWPNEKRSFIPCDYAAKIIVALTFGKQVENGVYNISYEAITWRAIIAYLNKLGYNIKLIPPEKWLEIGRARGDESLLHALIPYYAIDGKLTNQFPFIDQLTSGRVDTTKTKAALKQLEANIALVSPEQLLERYVGYFIESGFFPEPAGHN
jgi:thioester reductase-like protein